jgi:DNA-binding transcriptional ArsR family regulator
VAAPANPDRAGIDRVFHALGDGTRRAILEALSQRPQSISRLAEPLGLTLAAVVQHIQLLEDAGLVATEKVGRVRVCKIEPGGIALAARWLEARRTLWEQRLDRLGDMLDEPEGG